MDTDFLCSRLLRKKLCWGGLRFTGFFLGVTMFPLPKKRTLCYTQEDM